MESKYQKVIAQIKSEIASGRLKPGSRLPSIREMAEDFGCNKTTVIRAYTVLEQEHLLYSKPKSGYYVVEDRDVNALTAANADIIDFSPAAPDAEALPYLEFQHSINKAIDIYRDSLFSYTDPKGLAPLRKTLQKYLQNFQVFAGSEEILITTGSQQALYILSAMPFPNGKNNVLVEQPTFTGMLGALSLHGVAALGIERTQAGINLEELERIFKNGNIKFFYTIPRFHNPTGFSYTNDQKKAIVSLARKYDVYIVEDDYLSELETDKKSDPMYAWDSSSNVVYVKSFSKTLMPGLRIASVVLPKLLVNTFASYKRVCDLNTPVLSQGALEIYLKSGMFENHVKDIKKLYQYRMGVLSKASEGLKAHGAELQIPNSGLFAYLALPEGTKAQGFVSALNTRNVYVTKADIMFLP
ncbi:MAG: PLP-dependent aminotransferase family protein, partial [Pseudomonadota bacterium]